MIVYGNHRGADFFSLFHTQGTIATVRYKIGKGCRKDTVHCPKEEDTIETSMGLIFILIIRINSFYVRGIHPKNMQHTS